MDARRSYTARPASESPRGRKPRATTVRYGDLSERVAALLGTFDPFFAAAGLLLAVVA